MNIYLLNATETAFLPAHLLAQQLPIKGLIGLKNTPENNQYNEYWDYEDFCRQHEIDYVGLSSYTMKDPADRQLLESLDIDILLSISWQRLVPDWLIQHCKIGVVGSHGSPLGISKGRGRSPQNWALLLGCDHFSYSIFWIDPGIDSGAIIDTYEFDYSQCDDILTSYCKAGLAMAQMMVKNYHNGNLENRRGTPQVEEGCEYLPQRRAEDGAIDWRQDCREVYDFVRALTRPYPGAFTTVGGKTMQLWQSKFIQQDGSILDGTTPGEVLLIYPGGEVLVRCGEGLLLVTDYTLEEGLSLSRGMILESVDFTRQLEEIVQRHQSKYEFPVSRLLLDKLDENGG